MRKTQPSSPRATGTPPTAESFGKWNSCKTTRYSSTDSGPSRFNVPDATKSESPATRKTPLSLQATSTGSVDFGVVLGITYTDNFGDAIPYPGAVQVISSSVFVGVCVDEGCAVAGALPQVLDISANSEGLLFYTARLNPGALPPGNVENGNLTHVMGNSSNTCNVTFTLTNNAAAP